MEIDRITSERKAIQNPHAAYSGNNSGFLIFFSFVSFIKAVREYLLEAKRVWTLT